MNLKTLNLTVLLVTILVLVPTIQIVYASPLSTFYLSGGIYPQADYTVWKEGTYYYAKDLYGFIPSWGKDTNFIDIMYECHDALPNGGIIQLGKGLFYDNGIEFDQMATGLNAWDLISMVLFFKMPNVHPVLNYIIGVPIWISITWLAASIIIAFLKSLPFT